MLERANKVQEGSVEVRESQQAIYHLYVCGLVEKFWLVGFRTFLFSKYEDTMSLEMTLEIKSRSMFSLFVLMLESEIKYIP